MTEHPDAQKAYFAGVFSRSAASYDRVGPGLFAHFGRRLVASAGIMPGMRVLDVACGRGAVLLPAAEQAALRAVGVDLAGGMLHALRAELAYRQGIHAVLAQMDAERLALRGAWFDAVLCGLSIFFLPDPVAGLGEFRRVAKPGGTITVSTFARLGGDAYRWQEAIFRRYLPPSDPDAPKGPDYHTAEGMHALFARAGIATCRVDLHEWEMVLSDEAEWWEWQWSHARRGILERIPPDELEAVKAELFAGLKQHIEPDGIHIPVAVLCTVGAA